LKRRRVGQLNLDSVVVHRWRFGLPESRIVRCLRDLAKDGWFADEIYIECPSTVWWEGAAEVIGVCKQLFPRARVVLAGSYATLAPDHARAHTLADDIVADPWWGLATVSTDLSLYDTPPSFASILVGTDTRTADDVIGEIVDKASRHKIKSFVIADHNVVSRFPHVYRRILERLAEKSLKVKLYALGNIAPFELSAHPDLAELMKRAGYAQVFFADDRISSGDAESDERLVEAYREAAQLLHRAGFALRTDKVNGALSVGRLGEDLTTRARLTTQVAHRIGSVILVPYQPTPEECTQLPLEAQNGKLFPFRNLNGVTYRDYLDLMGLAVVLNAKHRSRTFDFSADGLIPHLLRESIERRGWDPDPSVKGALKLPLVKR